MNFLRNAPDFFETNANIVDFGPGGMISIVFDNTVGVFQQFGNSIMPFRAFSFPDKQLMGLKWKKNVRNEQYIICIMIKNEGFRFFDVLKGVELCSFIVDLGEESDRMGMCWSFYDENVVFLCFNKFLFCANTESNLPRNISTSGDALGLDLKIENMQLFWTNSTNLSYCFVLCNSFNHMEVLFANNMNEYIIISHNHDFSISNMSKPSSFGEYSVLLQCEFYPFASNKLVLLYRNVVIMYQTNTKTSTKLITLNDSEFCPMGQIFSTSLPNDLWLCTKNGTALKYRNDNPSWNLQYYYEAGKNCIYGSLDNNDPRFFCSLYNDNEVLVFKDNGNEVLCERMSNFNVGEIVAFNCKKNNLVYVTNKGFICLKSDFMSKYLTIDDHMVNQVYFVDDSTIVLSGQLLYVINLNTREVNTPFNWTCPKKSVVFGKSIAISSDEKSIDIFFENGNEKQLQFSDPVTHMASNDSDPSRIVVLSSKYNALILCFIEGNIEKIGFKIPNTIGVINHLCFHQQSIVAVTSFGIIFSYKYDTQKKSSYQFTHKELVFSTMMNDQIMVIDEDNTCFLMDFNTMHTISSSRYDIIKCLFLSDTKAVVHTHNNILNFVDLPTFTTSTNIYNSQYIKPAHELLETKKTPSNDQPKLMTPKKMVNKIRPKFETTPIKANKSSSPKSKGLSNITRELQENPCLLETKATYLLGILNDTASISNEFLSPLLISALLLASEGKHSKDLFLIIDRIHSISNPEVVLQVYNDLRFNKKIRLKEVDQFYQSFLQTIPNLPYHPNTLLSANNPNISDDIEIALDFLTEWKSAHEGVSKIYQIIKKQPDLDISRELSSIDFCFRKYIFEGLRTFAREDNNHDIFESINNLEVSVGNIEDSTIKLSNLERKMLNVIQKESPRLSPKFVKRKAGIELFLTSSESEEWQEEEEF